MLFKNNFVFIYSSIVKSFNNTYVRLLKFNDRSCFWDLKSKNMLFLESKTFKHFFESTGHLEGISLPWIKRAQCLLHAHIKLSGFMKIIIYNVLLDLTKAFFKRKINHFEENIFCAFKHLNQLERRKTVEKEVSTWKFNDYHSRWIKNCKINVHLASQNWIIN